MSSANLARPSELLAKLFSPMVVAASELRGTADPTMLLPEEAAACGTFRAARLEEFTGGRLCARRALSEFGLGAFAVRRNVDRTPQWPAGIVGSITHTIGFCGAVVGSCERFAGLGIDAEIVARVTPDVWTQTLTREDITRISGLSPAERERAAAVIFSAKEAFYKCISGVTGAWLDYRDVCVELIAEAPDSGTFLVRSASATARRVIGSYAARGRYSIADALVFTGIALTPDDVRDFAPRRLEFVS
jgi:4'-phosphopantetheinyl transferase EntD